MAVANNQIRPSGVNYPYTPKQVVVYASDLLVYINGLDELFVCGSDSSRARFTDSITSASVDLKVDGVPGSASFSLAVPRHSDKRYFQYGKCVIKPMMEVTMFLKGRYLDQNKRPVYYKAFWGVVTDISVEYGSTQHTINVTCQDILYFWAITRLATNPSVFQQNFDNTIKLTEYTSIFNHLSPHQIILTLARVMTGSLLAPQNMPAFKQGQAEVAQAAFGMEQKSMQDYWRMRQQAIGGRLRLWGSMIGSGDESIKGLTAPMDQATMDSLTGGAIASNKAVASAAKDQGLAELDGEGNLVSSKFPLKQSMVDDMRALAASADTKSKEGYSLDSSLFDQYFPYNTANQVSDFSTGDDMSRLEVANQVKEFIGYEFYMDVTGEIIFKPPFYNVDVRENDPVSIIRDLEIISFTESQHIQEILTRLDVTGCWDVYKQDGDVNSLPHGSYVDYRLAREFGIKSETLTRSFLHSSDMCIAYAISELSKFNAKRYSSSLTIIGRPELRLGYPIYIESQDTFYYIEGITHTYSPNGKLETQLTLTGKRSKYIPYDLAVKEGRSKDFTDPLRPRYKGVANVVLIMDIPCDTTKTAHPVGQGNKTISLGGAGGAAVSTTPAAGFANIISNLATDKLNQLKSSLQKTQSATPASKATQKTPAETKAAASPDGDGKKKTVPLEAAAKGLPCTPVLGADGQPVKDGQGKVTNQGHVEIIPPNDRISGNGNGLLDRVIEGAAGIEFQTYGRPREIVQPGVYTANLRQIPVSDEFGYELIGGFGYGRGVKLDPVGVLKTYLPQSEIIGLKPEALKVVDDLAKKIAEMEAKSKGGKPDPGLKRLKEAYASASKPKDPAKVIEALMKAGRQVDPASVIKRITGEPDLVAPAQGHAFDEKEQDYVTRYNGKTTGTYRHQDVGVYLTDMGHKLAESYTGDAMECDLNETEAIAFDGKSRSLDNNKNLFSGEQHLSLASQKTLSASDPAFKGVKVDDRKIIDNGGSKTGGGSGKGVSQLGAAHGPNKYASNVIYNKEKATTLAQASLKYITGTIGKCYTSAGLALNSIDTHPPGAQDHDIRVKGLAADAWQWGEWAKSRPDLYVQYTPKDTSEIIPGTVLIYDRVTMGNTSGHIEIQGEDGHRRCDSVDVVRGGATTINLWIKQGLVHFYLPK